jgi:hypothetical protein
MEHTHRPVLTCEHVMKRSNKFPDVIWIDAGKIEAAVCFDCAHSAKEANVTGGEPPEAMRPICAECARVEGLPTNAKMPDGFYEWHDGQWEKQPDLSEPVN